MNSILLLPEEVGDKGEFSVCGPRAEEIFDAHGSSPRTRFKAGILGCSKGEVSVAAWSKDLITGQYIVTAAPEARISISVIVGAARPQGTKRVLQLATMMGIEEVLFVATLNSQKSYLSSQIFEEYQQAKILRRALEQAQDVVPPVIERYWSLKRCLETLTARYEEKIQLIYADTRESLAPAEVFSLQQTRTGGNRLVLALGPEGGWHDTEREEFDRFRGWVCSLGSRILTVDVAFAALVAHAAITPSLIRPQIF
jgi:16S rRNA (uracil1498-N3)-methyltransferase